MRLSEQEISTIRKVILSIDPQAEIYLHGSRAVDVLKGGDIDLLVLSERIAFAERLTILTELKMQLGDQKIDLTVRTRAAAKQDPFTQSILPRAIQL